MDTSRRSARFSKVLIRSATDPLRSLKILKDLGKKIEDPQGSWQEFLRTLVKIFIRILWRSLKILERFSPGLSAGIECMFHQMCSARWPWSIHNSLVARPRLDSTTNWPSNGGPFVWPDIIFKLFQPCAKKDSIRQQRWTLRGCKTVKRNFYVDDCLKSVRSVKNAGKVVDQLQEIISRGRFRLTKWSYAIGWSSRYKSARRESSIFARSWTGQG